jgi:hypothetical protein
MKLFGAAKGTFLHLALEKFQVTHSDNNLEASFWSSTTLSFGKINRTKF